MTNEGKGAYRIRYQECEGYLHAFITGEEDSVEAALEYWRSVIDECDRRGLKGLLVEEDFPNQLSTMDMYTVTTAIPQMVSAGLRIAFVDQEADHSDLNLFGETVAVNRGVNGRVFPTLEHAQEWLKS